MSVTVDSLAFVNPNPSSSSPIPRRRASMVVLQPFPMSMRFESLSRPQKVCISAHAAGPIRLGLASPPLHSRGSVKRWVFASSASHEESKPSEIDSEKEKIDIKVEGAESQEAWRQTLESFKEQALKMQSMSQEAFDLYSKKAMVILLETSEKLKIEAEKARQDLSVVAKEISEESKEYLSTAADKSPESVKEIVETFSSSTDIKEISEVRDFYLGIPYGMLLSVSGFLSFMLTGSTSGIRFGVILGGVLLALSFSSLRSWKRGESFPLALKGQAAIASILFLRKIQLLLESPSFLGCFTALFSAAMVAFYVYRIKLDSGQSNSSNFKHGAES